MPTRGKIMVLHLRCPICDFLDICLIENGKNWKCFNCQINQPERLSGLESEMTMRQSEPDNERSGVIQK